MMAKITKINCIGFFWILLGIFAIFTRNFEAVDISLFILSIDIVLSFTISILSIVIGICFILRKRWAHKAMIYLSTALIVGICCLGIRMIINGILDIIKDQSLTSSITLIFGFIVFTSSIPFFLVIKSIKSKKISDIFHSIKYKNQN
jgi:hypothetical protein